jgi:hypothetical protein
MAKMDNLRLSIIIVRAVGMVVHSHWLFYHWLMAASRCFYTQALSAGAEREANLPSTASERPWAEAKSTEGHRLAPVTLAKH